MQPFVALDFETANQQRWSACSLGMVKFDQHGEPSDSYYQLIHPHPEADYFDPWNIRIHGITPKDVQDAPQWGEIAPDISAFIAELPIVAHNMAFDGYVMSDLATIYHLDQLTNRRFCTLRLARKILANELPHKNLDLVYNYYFPGEQFNHHNAAADALVAGRIFAQMQREYPYSELEKLCPPTGVRL